MLLKKVVEIKEDLPTENKQRAIYSELIIARKSATILAFGREVGKLCSRKKGRLQVCSA